MKRGKSVLQRQVDRSSSQPFQAALRVALAYFIVSVLWIGLSDRVLEWVLADSEALTRAQNWKGWFFVISTALALFVVLLREGLVVEAIFQKMRASEQRFRSLFERIPSIAVQGYSSDRKVLFWNDASARLYGYSTEEAVGKALEDLIIPPAMHEGVIAAINAWIEHGEAIPAGELKLKRKDGSLVPVYSAHVLIENLEGKPELYCLDIDQTQQKQAEAQLRLAEVVFDRTADGIIVTDAENSIISINESFSRISGYSLKELLGKTPNIFSSGRHGYSYYAQMWRDLLEQGYWHGEILNRRKNGDVYCGWMAISAVSNESGTITNFVGIISDISEKKAIEARLEHVANHDDLTGLPNALLLRDRASQALALSVKGGRRVGLVVLDLDHFRVINDSLGHVIGDRLLKLVVARLSECLDTGCTLSRRGGDELLVLLPNVGSPEQVRSTIECMLHQFATPFVVDRNMLTVTASMGAALFPEDASDFDDLMLKAETAMYSAKQSGRNTCRFFAEQMNADAHERFSLQNRLGRAIDRGELILHYQPQYDLKTGALIGAEALIRWADEGRGLVPPGKFIPIAEESGLIIPISEWVMMTACRQAQSWRDEGYPDILLAVNLSALQFKRSNLVASVANALSSSGLPAQCLELELTESILVDDADGVLRILNDLKSLGVQLAIDDFGTGYSSLAYLKKYPIDKLKIDQSFVRDIVDDDDDAAIVHTIIQLGRNLKMTTLAEGVETESQLAFLKVEGCRIGQGYLFGRPVPAEEFIRFFKKTSAV